MPPSVLRRYTPPTCTLEVRANGSALSRWTDQTVLKNVRFTLRFDDPRCPTEQQVEVRGDRPQLEALHATVSDYVARLLNPEPDAMDPMLLRLAPERSPLLSATSAGQLWRRQDGDRLEAGRSGDELNLLVGAEGIALKPLGLLSHELQLGSLAEEIETVRLTTTQLVDLAEALDAYTAEALAIDLPGRAGQRRSPEWLRVAAVVVLTVGVTGSLAKFVMDVNSPPASTVATENAEPLDENTALRSPAPFGTELPPGAAGSPSPAALPTPPAIPTVPPGATLPLPTPPAPGQAALPPPVLPGGASRPTAVPAAPPQLVVPPPAQRPAAAPAPALIPDNPVVASQPGEGPAALSAPADPAAGAIASDSAAPEAAAMRSAPAPNARVSAGSIPQVAEAQQYFQSRWQPPENLERALEYRVVVAANGSVQQVVPLGEAAGIYIDRSGMPLMGESVVSPLPNGRSATLRVVLYPDGRVQTLLEGTN